jgi:class 3 adenylate cyclase
VHNTGGSLVAMTKGFYQEQHVRPPVLERNVRSRWSSVQRTGSCVYVSRCRRDAMSEARKLVAILVADVVGYSKLAGSDEERTLARLRALRSDLIDPTIALHHGRIV